MFEMGIQNIIAFYKILYCLNPNLLRPSPATSRQGPLRWDSRENSAEPPQLLLQRLFDDIDRCSQNTQHLIYWRLHLVSNSFNLSFIIPTPLGFKRRDSIYHKLHLRWVLVDSTTMSTIHKGGYYIMWRPSHNKSRTQSPLLVKCVTNHFPKPTGFWYGFTMLVTHGTLTMLSRDSSASKWYILIVWIPVLLKKPMDQFSKAHNSSGASRRL